MADSIFTIMKILTRIALGSAVLILLFCNIASRVEDSLSRDIPLGTVQHVLRTSTAIAFATTAAFALVNNATPDNVEPLSTIARAPGPAVLHFRPKAGVPLPPGISSNQSIVVAGIWEDTGSAVLSVFFLNSSILGTATAVLDFMTFPVVMRADNVLTIVFASEDINTGNDTTFALQLTDTQIDAEFKRYTFRPSIDSSVTVSQDAWIIDIHTGGTPAIMADDAVRITGAGQNVHFSLGNSVDLDLVQIVSIDTRFGASCGRNPDEGYMLARNFGLRQRPEHNSLGSALFQFGSTCDGKCKIPAATGHYLLNSGHSISLEL